VIALHVKVIALGGVPVLHDIAFQARAGEMVALCGPNGAGKTTLLRALAGLLPGMKAPDPRQVAYLAQGVRSAWGLTVADIVALGRLPHGDRDREAIAHAMRMCGVADLHQARIDRISGGQARRAMLARVVATGARVLLLDEPTADLDPDAAHAIMALLAELARAGAAVVVVLHALDLVRDYADRMVVLQRGRVIADATPDVALPVAAAAFGLPYGVDLRPRLLPPSAI
jgi:iron complex transport system ATP-binding protein